MSREARERCMWDLNEWSNNTLEVKKLRFIDAVKNKTNKKHLLQAFV